MHGDYLIKGRDLLTQSTQPDLAKAKKGKGKQCEMLQFPTKNAKDALVEVTTAKKVETSARCLPRIVFKPLGKPGMVNNAINKRVIPQEVEESSTSKEDRNWR